VATLAAHRDPELHVQIGVLGSERDRAAELSLRGAQQPLGLEREAQIGVEVGVARLETDRPLVDARLVAPLALAAIDHREAQVRVEAVGLPAQRLEQGRLRVALSYLALEHAAQARPPARARGVEPRRAGVGGDRLAIA